MALTDAQLLTLKNAINANPTWAAIPLTYPAGATELAGLLNANTNPAYIVYKSLVPFSSLKTAVNGTEFGNLTTANHTRFQSSSLLYSAGISPSIQGERDFWADIFSSQPNTLAGLTALWRRTAREIEKIYAVGTGTTNSPSTLGYEGVVTPEEVHNARSRQG